ncbi:hypothetical protein HOS13_gp24 [Caulobacter phage Lullwater]|uniref:Uncharacterized protein n=1 Tax=Caulobacter phage Lullwater TaxID=2024607 RepID=A0A291LB32_9CAUD|nr:hypothetical protein HOS13_gp24 [Caulobacter phage Lullwater]ATI16331.1 hypothetical protein Lull_024 [Caulobacter phage Lullwater]
MNLLFLALMSFVQVFTLGFQSRCVNAGNYFLAFACSTLIGFSQVYVWHQVMSAHSFLSAAVYSLSGACAICTAIFVHKKVGHFGMKK